MEAATFKKAAAFIAQRNVSDRVERVFASFDADTGSLRLVYCTKGEPIEDDWEDCELTCSELIAEFPEIAHARTECLSADLCAEDDGSIIFIKP